MNEPKFGVRKWLWIVLASVIVIAAAYVAWMRYAIESTTKTATSPSPTKSAVVSPGTSPTATKSGTTTDTTTGTNSTPADNQAPTSSSTPNENTVKTFSGFLNSNGNCGPNISFQYSLYTLMANGDGVITLNTGKDDGIDIISPNITNAFRTTCIQQNEDIVKVFNEEYNPVGTFTYTLTTINGYDALRWDPLGESATLIQGPGNQYINIGMVRNASHPEVYDQILRSIKFQ